MRFHGNRNYKYGGLEADLAAARLPVFLRCDVCVALRQRDELRGRELVHPGGNALNRESQLASHRHDLAGAFRAIPWRGADRSHRPALPWRAAGSHTRVLRPCDRVYRLARPSAALAPLRHDADYRHRLGDVLGYG